MKTVPPKIELSIKESTTFKMKKKSFSFNTLTFFR